MANVTNIGTEIIEKIEKERKSKVIVYFTGDRKPFGASIAEDAVEPLYMNLLNLDFEHEEKKIDLFLYSRGGDVSVPWRIATMIREFCDEFNILIPYKAHSAATLLSLGADNIFMSKKGELGPIDPTLVKASSSEDGVTPQEISVEDVNSYISFIREKANINDQAALSHMIKCLVDQITPLTVGNVNRQNSHIRLVARKLLTSRNQKVDEDKIDSIIETLTEKMYSHGHGIGRKEAKEIGLPIENHEDKIENLIWELYIVYNNYLNLNDALFPEMELLNDDKKILENFPVAIIESLNKLHVHKTNIELVKNRKIPNSPQINVNLNLQLPPHIQPNQIPAQSQQILQELLGQVTQQLTPMVQQEIIKQSPVVGIGGRPYAGQWYEEK